MSLKMYKKYRPTFGDVVKVETFIKGMTEVDLAKLSGCALPTINRIIVQNRAVTLRTKVKVFKALGLDTDLLRYL